MLNILIIFYPERKHLKIVKYRSQGLIRQWPVDKMQIMSQQQHKQHLLFIWGLSSEQFKRHFTNKSILTIAPCKNTC